MLSYAAFSAIFDGVYGGVDGIAGRAGVQKGRECLALKIQKNPPGL